ncbi:conserved hypothetical protein [Ricinus communis]|uniref:Uncharacterized protein n=1 Tax=Ricinus communis TaxID=3988 RepID=B9SSF1_RICCO|nr:conserved hypothetical protein [Ricinus communis]
MIIVPSKGVWSAGHNLPRAHCIKLNFDTTVKGEEKRGGIGVTGRFLCGAAKRFHHISSPSLRNGVQDPIFEGDAEANSG